MSDPNGDGRIWLGGIRPQPGAGSRVALTYYNPVLGTWNPNLYDLTAVGYQDRPWLAIGPSTANPTVTKFYMMGVTDLITPPCYPANQEKTWIYQTTTPETQHWPGTSVIPVNPVDFEGCATLDACNYRGWASLPVVSNEGDIVVVARDRTTDPESDGSCYNQRRPYAYWSNDDGQTWKPTGDHPIKLGDGLVAAIDNLAGAGEFAETPHFVDRRTCSPAIAIDRHTNTVYVAFAARSDADSHKDQNNEEEKDWNSDIWIFKGTRQQTGEWVFGTDPDQVLQLTEQRLGIPINTDGKGPDQFVPAIAVDCAGGISLMFYDNRAETVAPAFKDSQVARQVDVYYARVTGWPDGNPSVYTKRLTPQTFTVGPTGTFLADYHTIGVGGSIGQWLYPVYISKDPVLEEWPGVPVMNCNMHSVFIRLCISDLNRNRAADTGDVDLFWEAFDEADSMADVTDDGFVNSDDVDEFIDVYSDALGG